MVLSLKQETERLNARAMPSKIEKIGRLKKMHLKNFMCHENLVVDFNERVNIFVGHNGSGKSAILTALVIGLGCSASTASRSSNIKRMYNEILDNILHKYIEILTIVSELIRRGENSCTIEITLDNNYIDAYEPEKYGRTISVSRHITLSGASSYKIRDEAGTVQSTSLTELKQLLMYMNIQVDNPICVLNQDAARTFLKE